MGTFLSPDTIVPDAGVVVDYNRFLYVRGNPLRFSDPSGHITVCFRGGYREQGIASSSSGSDEFWNVCEQTLLDSGYDPDKHGAILRLKNNDADIHKAVKAILAQEQTDASRPVILIGHSWGGAAALKTADLLSGSLLPPTVDPGVRMDVTASIDLLFLIDAESGGRWGPHTISSNVRTAVNLYAQATWPDMWWNLQNGVDHFEGARNIPASYRVDFGGNVGKRRVGHNSIVSVRDKRTGRTVPNPETFALIADYTTQTLFSGAPGNQP